ncbi:acyltransferase family protein [Acinetobacter junii]|uniref:acyltransferase family protein n=1 Tax=Acinetobacter junii TaxID=40215 RepID=UPI003A8770B4
MQKDINAIKDTNKLLGLEIIRFIAAFSVLIWHYQHFYYIKDAPENFIRHNQPYYNILSLFYDYGFFGVQIFWCISGFIFFWKYRELIADKKIGPKKFFKLRFSRLYPLHFITLLIVAFLQFLYFSKQSYFFVYQNNDLSHFILQLFLASNWSVESGFSFNGPIWSISVEVLAYFFFFVLLCNISKSYFLNFSIVFLYAVSKYLQMSLPLMECLAYFYMGGLSAIAYKYIENSKFEKTINIILVLFLVFIPLVVFNTHIHQSKFFTNWFLLMYMPILIFICSKKVEFSINTRKTIEILGNMTYSSYLIHFPLQLLIALYFLNIEQSIPYNNKNFFIGFVSVTLFLSYIVYKYFELPIQNILRKEVK